MRKVIIAVINGVPQSGKTTIQDKMKYLASEDCINAEVRIISSVKVPYKIMGILGWNGVKDDQFRADMVALKQMYIRYSNGPTQDIIREALNTTCNDDGCPCIICTDVREAEEIKKLVDLSKPLNIIGIECKTVYIQRDAVDGVQHGNSHDDNVADTRNIINYDIIINNNGDINSIGKVAMNLANQLLGIKEDEENVG